MERKDMIRGVTFEEGYGEKKEEYKKTSMIASTPALNNTNGQEYPTESYYVQNGQVHNYSCNDGYPSQYYVGGYNGYGCYNQVFPAWHFGSMGGFRFLDEKNQQEVILTAIKEEIRKEYEDEKRKSDFESKKAEAEYKAGLKAKQDEGREKLHQLREISVPSIRLDEEGRFVYRYVVGNKKYEESLPVFSVGCMKLQFLHSFPYQQDLIACISWKGAKKKVYLMENDISGKMLRKFLTKAGVEVRLNKKNRDQVLDQILAFLISNAVYREIPYRNGWCKMSNGWCYYSGEECFKKIQKRGSCIYER